MSQEKKRAKVVTETSYYFCDSFLNKEKNGNGDIIKEIYKKCYVSVILCYNIGFVQNRDW